MPLPRVPSIWQGRIRRAWLHGLSELPNSFFMGQPAPIAKADGSHSMRSISKLPLLLIAIVLPPTVAAAQELVLRPRPSASPDGSGEVFGGAEYRRGDYGTGAKVETVATTVGVSVRKGRVRFGVAVPYVQTTAPVDVVLSQGGLFGTPLLASGRTDTRRTKREGLGDANVQMAYGLPIAGFAASLGAGLKIPTASRSKGLGTGKADYFVNAQVSRAIGGRVAPFASVGYKIIGKPDDVAVHNVLSGSAGARVGLGHGVDGILSYSYEQSATRALTDSQSVAVGLGVTLRPKLRVGIQGEAGLSRGAADTTLGLMIGAGF